MPHRRRPELAGSAPATLAYKATAAATPALITFLPTSAGTNFLTHYLSTGWATVAPGYTPPPPPKPSDYGSEALTPGTIRYFGRTDGDQAWKDWFTPNNTPIANRTWLNSKVWRLEAFDGYAEPTTSWFSGGMIYYQLYTIDDTAAAAHPDWVLRDSTGAPLYAADGASPHKLVAGNIFNAGYRDYQIARINALFSDGNFRGVWLDNVNLEMSDSGLVRQLTWVPQPTPQDPKAGYYRNDSKVGALYGYQHPAYAKSGTFPAGENCATATVPSGGQLSITDSCWATGIAAFVSQVKSSLPAGKELLTNTPFFRMLRNVETYDFYRDANNRVPSGLPTAAGRSVTDAATYVDLEMSFWQNGEATGNGPATDVLTGPGYNGYSTDSIFRWIDAVHARGKGIVADSQTLRRHLEPERRCAGRLADAAPRERVQPRGLPAHDQRQGRHRRLQPDEHHLARDLGHGRQLAVRHEHRQRPRRCRRAPPPAAAARTAAGSSRRSSLLRPCRTTGTATACTPASSRGPTARRCSCSSTRRPPAPTRWSGRA